MRLSLELVPLTLGFICHTQALQVLNSSDADAWSMDGVGPPDWESTWMLMESQSDTQGYRIRRHPLGEVPWKVRVLIRILSGAYAGYMFEAATGGAMWDDDKSLPYCGVSYVYDNTTVKLYAPLGTDVSNTGRVACVGGSSWGNVPEQQMRSAKVRILAWRRSSFPPPDFLTEWIPMNETESFLELGHNITGDCSYMMVQVRGMSNSRNPGPWYAEAVGASQDPHDVYDRAAVVFGYSDSKVRVWRVTAGGQASTVYRKYPCLLCIRDGWANRRRVTISRGHVRVIGWSTLSARKGHIHREVLVNAADLTQGLQKVNLFRGEPYMEPQSLFISVQVKAIDGPNEGFRFPAFGLAPALPFEKAPRRNYGGVVYGLNGSSLEMFLPTGQRGFPVLIMPPWGGGLHKQFSKAAKVLVNVVHNVKSRNDGDKCYFKRLNVVGIKDPGRVERAFTCARMCCEQQDCDCQAYALDGTDHCTIFHDLLAAMEKSRTGKTVFVKY